MARLNLNLTSEIYQRLQREASLEGRSVSDVVRVLVNEWLKLKQLEQLDQLERHVIEEKEEASVNS